MLAELGRRADVAVERGTDLAHEAVHATVLHLRRIIGTLSTALVRATREAEDLVWDYQDVAGELRRSAPTGTGTKLPEVGEVELRSQVPGHADD